MGEKVNNNKIYMQNILGRESGRERQTDRQTDRQRQRQRRDRERQRQTDRERQRQRHRDTNRQTETQTETDRQRGVWGHQEREEGSYHLPFNAGRATRSRTSLSALQQTASTSPGAHTSLTLSHVPASHQSTSKVQASQSY